jgi:hypothetical protein
MENKMIIEVKKFGDILTSRPAGREAALICLAYFKGVNTATDLSLDFEGVEVMTPSWLSEFIQTLQEKGIPKPQFLPSENPTVNSSIEFIAPEID